MIPGEYRVQEGDIALNAGREVTPVLVTNLGDRPIQVGSHYHFYEVNAALSFPRMQALGKRLGIAAGTAVRFEPGEEKPVNLIPFGGAREIYGFNGLMNGPQLPEVKDWLLQKQAQLEHWLGVSRG
ncbi:urease subunit beta [Paenibacillus sp. J5C_2022]|uniref:urease subunit beta n=1 Tax=Paenibacillus sp. J5C2022 TaxID=2977129 RepID=UPI0021D08EDF|nr:urease subunit beta [Paenibacillus sp. J5C2022]MCU6707406.1 urease subunit beta [Paenibacillus sp. J5C2022]